MKKQALIIFGVLVSIIAIYLSLRGVNWSALPLAFSDMKLGYAVFFIPFFYLIFIIRAYRWKLILPKSQEQNLEDVFDATLLGFFATNVLPLRAGEFIRPWVYAKWSELKMLTCLASVIVERVFDVLALMLILGLSFSQITLPENLTFIILGAKALVFVAVAISILMLLAYFKPSALEFFVNKFCVVFLDKKFNHISTKINSLSTEFIQGLKSINTYRELLLVVLSSILLWITMALFYQFILWSFDPNAEVVVGFVLTAVIALSLIHI